MISVGSCFIALDDSFVLREQWLTYDIFFRDLQARLILQVLCYIWLMTPFLYVDGSRRDNLTAYNCIVRCADSSFTCLFLWFLFMLFSILCYRCMGFYVILILIFHIVGRYEGQRDMLYNQTFNLDQVSFAAEGIKDAQQTVSVKKLTMSMSQWSYFFASRAPSSSPLFLFGVIPPSMGRLLPKRWGPMQSSLHKEVVHISINQGLISW